MTKLGGKKILLVDYEVSKMKATEDFLSQAGFDVVKAFDGLDALEKFAEEQPNLVLLSAMLPKLHGFEVCKAIKQSDVGKNTPVLITTSVYKSYKYKRQAMKDYMADDYILKPFNYEELLIKIREHLGISDTDEQPAVQDTKRSERVEAEKTEKSKEDGQNFEKLLDETLETLLKTSEMEEIAEDGKQEKHPEKEVKEKDLDSILEDTLSGLLRVPEEETKQKKKTKEPKEKPVKEKPSPPSPEPSEPAQKPEEEKAEAAEKPSGEIDKIIDEAITIIDEAEADVDDEKGKLKEEAMTVQLPKSELDKAITPEESKPPKEEEGIRFGKYFLIEKVATGGMAELWRAKQKGPEGFQKLVALKRILPHLYENEDFITMFIDEGKVAAQLTHPNIAQIYELGEEKGSYYIAMEYIAGKDLRTIMKKARRQHHPIPQEIAVVIASKLLSGLHYAHRKKGFNNEPLNIVHRDVSPQNVLISYEGEVKLVDFGIAKAAAKNSVTQTGALKGKILYMSPEQAWGQTVDRRSDIFSVGVLLYEMMTGKRIFLADNEIAILQKVREWTPPPPSSANARISSVLDRIILKAIEKKPENRFLTAEEMLNDLENFLTTQQPSKKAIDLSLFMQRIFKDDIATEAPELLDVLEDQEEIPELTTPEPEDKESIEKAEIEEKQDEPEPVPIDDKSVPEITEDAEPSIEEKKPSEESIEDVEQKTVGDETVEPEKSEEKEIITSEEAIEPEIEDIEIEPEEETAQAEEEMEELEAEAQEEIEEAEELEVVAEEQKPEPVSDDEEATPEDKAMVGSEPEMDQEVGEIKDKTPMPVDIEAKEEEIPPSSIQEDIFTDDFLKPAQKETSFSFKDPKILGGIGGIILLIIIGLIFAIGGDDGEKVPATPTVNVAATQTATAYAAILAKTPSVTPTEPPTEVPTETPTPTQRRVVVVPPTDTPKPTVTNTPEPTVIPTETPSPVPSNTPLPTKIPKGTYIEYPEVKPEIVSRKNPSMPLAARKMKVSGTVLLRALVSENGDVLDVSVLRASKQLEKSGCVKAASEAVKKWKFSPASQDGIPVKTHISLAIPFIAR